MLWHAYKDAYLVWLSLHGGDLNVAKARDTLGRFTRYVDPLTLEQIDNPTYSRYLVRRRQDRGRCGAALSVATINGDIRYLNAAFSAALPPDDEVPDRLGLIESDSWRPPRMKLMREPRKRPKCLTQDLLGQVFDACQHAQTPALSGISAPEWWFAFFLVCYLTGVRCKALLDLPRPTEEELQHGVLRVPAEKDKADGERCFFLTPEAVTTIRRIPASADGRLFAWPHCRRYFYTVLHRFQTRAGIPPTNHGLPHDLRRTKGTELVKLGCSLPLVQRELGHSNPAVTERFYIGQISEAQREAIAALPLPEPVRRRCARSLDASRQLAMFGDSI